MNFSKIFSLLALICLGNYSLAQHESHTADSMHIQITTAGPNALTDSLHTTQNAGTATTGHATAPTHAEAKFDIAKMISHHISDSHDWHFATVGHKHITLPLPVILYSPTKGLSTFSSAKFVDEHHNPAAFNGYSLNQFGKVAAADGSKVYDFSITKNVAQLLLSALLMIVVFFSVRKGYIKNKGKAPTGIQSVFEPIITYIRDEIAIPTIGQKHYKRFLPYLLTLFFFIWFNNILGLLPGSANVTGNIAVTCGLAVIAFFVVNLNGKAAYWKHIVMPPGVPWPLYFLLVPVEIIGVLVKPVTLMVRLFANITAGHIILLSLIGLIFSFQNFFIGGTVSVFLVAMNILELLVALLQAFIFTLLTAIYIGSAVEEHHHEEGHEVAH
jgi:F-type H+-transporting ATPase subunit a